MNYASWCTVLVTALLLSGAGAPPNSDRGAQLRWLDHADAAEMSSRDIAQGRLRFFSVRGYSEAIPSVGHLNYDRCYRGTVVVQVIEGTSDSVHSAEELRLNRLAWTFAGAYNRLVVRHVRDKQFSACPPDADWDAAFFSLTDYVWGRSQLEGWVSYSETSERDANFVVALKDSRRAPALAALACDIFQRHGIRTPVTIEMRTYDDATSLGTVRCRDGRRITRP